MVIHIVKVTLAAPVVSFQNGTRAKSPINPKDVFILSECTGDIALNGKNGNAILCIRPNIRLIRIGIFK